MSHGFSRFGNPSARERFHAQARGGGSFTMFLPTILATLFLFTAVIALNKVTSLSNDKTIRLINVDDVFPDPAAVERNGRKEYWEAPPPPSPVEAADPYVISDPAGEPSPRFGESTGLITTGDESSPAIVTPPAIHLLETINTGVRMPDAKPDTSLPGPVTP